MKNDFLSLLLQAAPTEKWLFQSEKIYTVLAVVLIIWLGIIVYLLYLRRDVGRLEKELGKLAEHKAADAVYQTGTQETKRNP
jgi:CcmD family protein